ncbi:RNA polymerase sigma factor [Stygiobacter electus]|uniref:Sigma-70 family RNA polymerase sigma factor n=1 Tax=Stygiobacter electus TaxID=3032292 RepID=A0AAE3TCM6_9BACT|nr:sigma-70 family RNA polymerase sigma factor [Stygiobacter electus]MDF1612583.1 sigma-70 family RNA polymerase sigma factor [Stygiobacter electus]
MAEKTHSNNELLSHLFRVEYSKMTAVLCRHFGLNQIEIAEDIASETFLKASEVWVINGIPENPTAWLYTVAKNKTKDYLKRVKIIETKIKETIRTNDFLRTEVFIQSEQDFDFRQQTITDSQLAMIFAVCNPAISTESQICLALQILCGFSVEEIADAFLAKTETIKKRLLRARTKLRKDNFQINVLLETTIKSRIDTVLRTLYLLFNEGYFSKSNNNLIRKDLCSEAIRLALVLTENPLTNTPQTNALLALMCFQSSRFDARIKDTGETILFEQQDKNLWDKELIEKGNYYLVNACSVNEISKYHLEAAIAYWHTTPTNKKKWEHILKLYNDLILIEYSPMTALNRTFAFAKVYGNERAIKEAEKLNLNENNYYHSLLGYLYSTVDAEKAIAHYNKAISHTKSKTEKKTLMKEIERLNKKRNSS